ncbi:multicopper oxidase-domain-containing protein [Fennellomyces sp. T-0311]|nr:multicopper oxidase-domain-containing protein [Fennellomyces sp. T-0311]
MSSTTVLLFSRILVLIALLLIVHPAEAILRKFDLDITWSTINPDCYITDLPAPVVNGQFPAPTLYAFDGDEIEVNVCNKMDDDTETTIHFHGIKQYGTSYSDGVPHITQNPIKPGDCYLYKFQIVDQSGTYYYHAHVGMQDDTVSGAFIVYPNEAAQPGDGKTKLRDGPYEYDEEIMVYMNEWWHQPYYEREAYYQGIEYTLDLGSGSILFNGRSVHIPLGVVDKDCPGFTVFKVEPGKTYRMRIIGAHTYQILGLAIADHPLTIMEVDGVLTEPYETDYIEMIAGQRISLLFKAKEDVGDRKRFTIATSYRWHFKTMEYSNNGYAFIDYIDKGQDTTPETTLLDLLDPAKKEIHGIVDPLLIPPLILTSLPVPFPWEQMASINIPDLQRQIFQRKEADRTIMVTSVLNKMPDGRSRFRINDAFPPVGDPITPVLFDMIEKFIPDMDIEAEAIIGDNGYFPRNRTFYTKHNEVVDIVFQDSVFGVFPCMTHSWHIHGHSHLLIASGPGAYDHERDKDTRTYPRPVLKDISAVPGTLLSNEKNKYSDNPTETGCGWTKVRIYTDNPGYWLMHCHITPHMLQGKWAVLAESPELISSTLRYPVPNEYHPKID